MKQLFFKGGRPILTEVPEPALAPGRLLVEIHYSAVSPGTEGGLLERSGRSLLSLALEKRHRVDRLWSALRRGDLADLHKRFERLSDRRQAWLAPGYSAAGIVRAVGPAADPFAPGDRVAVAGAGYAVHAERVTVPRNLAVPLPRDLDLASASTVAIGAIALQSVRRADPRIGETVLVLGLGLLGQFVARILLAAGCRVLGWDPQAARLALAEAAGVTGLHVDDIKDVPGATAAETGGHGADQVIVAASGGAAVTGAGAEATRRSGTLVLLGDTPVQVDRATAYERELTIRMSTSYGPGRYDRGYEEEGIDYPYAHVRWTETRNMSAWLDLLAAGRVVIDDLTSAVRDLEEAGAAYLALRQGRLESLGLIFRHPAGGQEAVLAVPLPSREGNAPAADVAGLSPQGSRHSSADLAPTPASPPRAPVSPPLRVALLGTGAYAATGILPPLMKHGREIHLELLGGTVPARREPLAQKHGFARTGSSYEEAASDPQSDLIVIATRHDLHANLVTRALEAGRAVYCEKPLALSIDELEQIEPLLQRQSAFLAIGFNRRFAPGVDRLCAELISRRGPLQISYRVQAGPLPAEHWIRGPQGGGRLIGECVHMVDLCRCLVGAPLQSAGVLPGGAGPQGDPGADNFQLSLGYADGSTATILYTSRGSTQHSKERIELHWDGRTLELDDFRLLQESGRSAPLWKSSAPQKGQEGLWRACVRALLDGRPSPTPADQLLETSRAVLVLEEARRNG